MSEEGKAISYHIISYHMVDWFIISYLISLPAVFNGGSICWIL